MDGKAIRTLLFVPGDQEKIIHKALGSAADAVIVDLEDAVGLDRKSQARTITRETLRTANTGKKPVFVCLNAFDTGMTATDLAAVMSAKPSGIVLPKCESTAEIDRLAHYLDILEIREEIEPGRTRILTVATETAKATLSLGRPEAATNDRLWGLLWGGEDLSATVARHCSCKCATLKAGDGDGLQNVNLVHSFQGSILFFGVVLSSLFLALERVSSSMSLSDIAAA